jgi:FixJ family two-component response regulator
MKHDTPIIYVLDDSEITIQVHRGQIMRNKAASSLVELVKWLESSEFIEKSRGLI